MSSTLDAITNQARTVTLNGKTVTIAKITTRQLLALVGAFNRIKGDLGLNPADVSLDAEGLRGLLEKVLSSLTEDEGGNLAGPALAVADTIARLFGVEVADLLDSPLDDLYSVLAAYWEVNSSGPLGQRVRHITAGLSETVDLLKGLAMANLQRELIRALPSGGMGAGGMTPSSSPSTASSDGPKNTSSTDSLLLESSESQEASDTSTSTEQPPSEPSNQEAEATATAQP